MRKTGRRLVMVVVGAALCWMGQAGAAPGGLPHCQAELATCYAALGAAQQFPATGQTTSYTAGNGGDIQARATLRYTDNGDGTITDNNTKLVWEKKSADSSIHDKDTKYTWANAFAVHIVGLNAGLGFAGHTDWRLPNVKELLSIVNYETLNPAVSPAFNTRCVAGCTVLTCSCTAAFYWSSSTGAGSPAGAWVVFFNIGSVRDIVGKGNSLRVRAVRGRCGVACDRSFTPLNL